MGTEEALIPNPGSKEAILRGCRCSVRSNNNGNGAFLRNDGVKLFWYSPKCKLHEHSEAN